MDELQNHIEEWIHRLSVPEAKLGGFKTCPYAKQASFVIFPFATSSTIEEFMLESVGEFRASGKEVGICVDVHGSLGAQELKERTAKLNAEYMKTNIVLLDDHPDTTFEINGHRTTNGKYPLVIIQWLDELERRSRELDKVGYYSAWSEKALNEVVRWRYKDGEVGSD